MIRAKSRGEAVARRSRRQRRPRPPKPNPRPAAKAGKKIKRAEARPTLVWLGDAKLKELADRINAELGAGTVSIVQAALLVTTDKLVDVALFLRDKNPIKYDYLASLQSVHYEDCIEVNYQLDSTDKPGTLIELRVRTAEAEGQGEVPSLYHVYRGADFQEREVYDMMGVRFTGHPELTRILMWEGYAYHPLRKDFLEPYYEGPTKVFASRVDEGLGQHFRAEEINPYGTNMKVPKDFKDWASLSSSDDPKGMPLLPGGVEIDELDTDQFVVSMGPQHPSTHGVFRINLRVDGETIVGLKPVMGYMHRNHEKIGERNTFLMNFPFTDRLDYLTSMGNNFGYALAVEQLMGDDAKPPERAEYIRVIMAELTRIASHMWSIGFLLNDLGAFFTPALYAIEERELILDLFEWAAGSRMMCNYFRFGGVAFDLPPGWIERCRGIVNDRIDKQDRRARPLPLPERDRARPLQGSRRPDPRAGDQLLDRRPGPAGLGRRLRHPPRGPVQHLRPLRLQGHHRPERRPLRPILRAPAGDAQERPHLEAGGSRHPGRPDPARQEELPDQGARGRSLFPGREPQGRARLLRRGRRLADGLSLPRAQPELHQPDRARGDVPGPHDRRRRRHPGKPRHRAGRGRPVRRAGLLDSGEPLKRDENSAGIWV